MKLYPKKLHSIEDLKREKKLVQGHINELDKEELFSLSGLLGGGGNADGDDSNGGIMSLLSMLPISNPLISMGAKAIQGLFSRKRKASSADGKDEHNKDGKKGKNMISSLAFEVLGGYLKWKAIELSYKGARHLVKKRKERNNEE